MILQVISKRIGEQFVLTRCTGGCCILNGLNLTDELVDMEEVLAHVGGQHHVDEAGPDRLVDLRLEPRQDVDPGVAVGQLEAQGAVVILQHRGVIVQDGQLRPGVTQVSRVAAGVIHIVNYCSWNVYYVYCMLINLCRMYYCTMCVFYKSLFTVDN